MRGADVAPTCVESQPLHSWEEEADTSEGTHGPKQYLHARPAWTDAKLPLKTVLPADRCPMLHRFLAAGGFYLMIGPPLLLAVYITATFKNVAQDFRDKPAIIIFWCLAAYSAEFCVLVSLNRAVMKKLLQQAGFWFPVFAVVSAQTVFCCVEIGRGMPPIMAVFYYVAGIFANGLFLCFDSLLISVNIKRAAVFIDFLIWAFRLYKVSLLLHTFRLSFFFVALTHMMTTNADCLFEVPW
jgi:hypothetical protein